MNPVHARRRIASALLAAGLAASGAAHAQAMKPGLWEHSFKMKSSSGQIERGLEQMQAQLAKLPPEQRKQMEAMMASRGVGIGGGSGQVQAVRVCVTPEQAARVEVPSGDGNCQQKELQRSGSTIKMSFVCAGPPPSSGQSEITLKGDAAYSGRTIVDTTVQGKPERMTMDVNGKWLSADCGNVQPRKR